MLEVQSLSIAWQGISYVSDASLTVAAGEIVTLTGPNGSGKSSLISAIAGLGPFSKGRVIWHGQDVTRTPLHRRTGVALIPEGRLMAPSLTVIETLKLGAGRIGRMDAARRLCDIWDRFPVLADRRNQTAGTLSGGEAQLLSMGRALMSRPDLLLLDEPTLGLSPAAAKATFQTLAALRAAGMSVLLTDQNHTAACTLADRVYAISNRHLVTVPSGFGNTPQENIRC